MVATNDSGKTVASAFIAGDAHILKLPFSNAVATVSFRNRAAAEDFINKLRGAWNLNPPELPPVDGS